MSAMFDQRTIRGHAKRPSSSPTAHQRRRCQRAEQALGQAKNFQSRCSSCPAEWKRATTAAAISCSTTAAITLTSRSVVYGLDLETDCVPFRNEGVRVENFPTHQLGKCSTCISPLRPK